MLETAIALIVGFAIGYGSRVALPPKASSGETAAGSFWDITLSGMTRSTLQVTRVVPSPGPLPCRNHQRVGALTLARHCNDVLDRMHDPLDWFASASKARRVSSIYWCEKTARC